MAALLPQRRGDAEAREDLFISRGENWCQITFSPVYYVEKTFLYGVFNMDSYEVRIRFVKIFEMGKTALSVERLNELGGIIVDCCVEVHKVLGPGLLESVYVFALMKELELRGIKSKRNVPIRLYYKGHDTGKEYEIDLLVEDEIVIEAKSKEQMLPVFNAQLISHLKLTEKRLGYLVNFNVSLMKDGIKRLVNGLY